VLFSVSSLQEVRIFAQEILEHQSKRQIELELMKFRETMEERGYGEEEIEIKVAEVRKKLTNQVRFHVELLSSAVLITAMAVFRS
jgi:hypothetical protein